MSLSVSSPPLTCAGAGVLHRSKLETTEERILSPDIGSIVVVEIVLLVRVVFLLRALHDALEDFISHHTDTTLPLGHCEKVYIT